MSIKYSGPNIITDGLVLNFDAGSQSSFTLADVEVLAVGGGGGGAGRHGGAGGGGGVVYVSSHQVTPEAGVTVTIGSGGATSTNFAVDGGNTVFGTLIAKGGTRGRTYGPGDSQSTGGSGGGGAGQGDAIAGNLGTQGQGFDGGRGSDSTEASGGGGGAGGPGFDAIHANGGDGGPGLVFNISGVPVGYGGGGGGCTSGNQLGGKPGRAIHGGGQGSTQGDPYCRNGVNGTGGGGGGQRSLQSSTSTGGTGGSGIVIVRYPGPQKATGGNTITNVGGYTIHTFTTSGTFTPSAAPANGGAVYGLQDLSGNNNTGTQSGGVTYSSANGGSIVFDGTNDYITTGYNPGIVTKLTVSVWLKVGTYANDGAGIAIGTNSLGTGQCYLGRGTSGGNSIDWRFYTGSYLDETEFFTNSTDWQHITGTYDQDTGQGRMRLYSNGNLVDTALSNNTSGINFSTGSNIRIGTNTGDNSFFGGNISQVSIYNRALSAAEVSQNFNATKGRFGL